MKQTVEIADGAAFSRTLRRLAHEILEHNPQPEKLLMVGILRRGAVLADLLAEEMEDICGVRPPCETLDITLYRDDLTEAFPQPDVKQAAFSVRPEGRTVILTDDVIYTGRTARAAMEAVIDMGRPSCIRLAVMVDRGHRELPIRADYVGKNIPTSREELVQVLTVPYDGCQGIRLIKP